MSDRYATNAFIGFNEYEAGVFDAPITAGTVMGNDNPGFLYPPKVLNNPATGNKQKVQRGYMRMISNGMTGVNDLAKKRLHFQFNPDTIVRAVTARNDIQFWMNQSPEQLMQPIPGDSNFAFELLFNREPEVVTGTYNDGGVIRESRVKPTLPITGAGDPNAARVDVPHSAVTDIGVLADLMVFDEIIGQGINRQLIDQVLRNAESRNTLNQTRRGSTSNAPATTASLSATVTDGVVTKVDVVNSGSGYITSPTANFSGGGGTGLAIDVKVNDGKVTSVDIISGGSGYTSAPSITLSGGGDGSGTAATGTSDSQDSESTDTPFDKTKAERSLYNNFGNSAFLISTPVRIVFSSLFMVEGYITSTTVTFNKFNANMVPTQCAVGISMQALYIGFARKDTFLTLTLDEIQEDYNNAGLDERSAAALRANVALGNNLFSPVVIDGNGRIDPADADNEERPIPRLIMDGGTGGDYTQTLSLRLFPTTRLKDEVKKQNNIRQLDYTMTWAITYLGNTTNTPAITVPSALGINETVTMSKNGTITTDKIKKAYTVTPEDDNPYSLAGAGLLIREQFKLPDDAKLRTDETYDTTATSLYTVAVSISFILQMGSGESVNCAQKYNFVKRGISFSDPDKTALLRNGSVSVPSRRQ